jgi:hypothetical protein
MPTNSPFSGHVIVDRYSGLSTCAGHAANSPFIGLVRFSMAFPSNSGSFQGIAHTGFVLVGLEGIPAWQYNQH